MTYKEILDDVLAQKWVRPAPSHTPVRMTHNGFWEGYHGHQCTIMLSMYKRDCWELSDVKRK